MPTLTLLLWQLWGKRGRLPVSQARGVPVFQVQKDVRTLCQHKGPRSASQTTSRLRMSHALFVAQNSLGILLEKKEHFLLAMWPTQYVLDRQCLSSCFMLSCSTVSKS